MIGIGIGIPFRRMGAGIDPQAQAHYDRVIADGGLIPSGLVGVNNFFTTVKGIYGTSDITTAISVGLDAQVLGYKLGAGAGTTAGQAAQKLYSCSGSGGDVEQTTAASQPLLLVHSGANYWFGSGVSGNFCSTPNAPANQITGDIELTAYNIRYVSGGNQSLISKNRYSFYITSGNILAFEDSSAVTTYSTANIGATFTGSVRVFRTSTEIKFYTSTDNINFTQLGTTITVSTTLSGGGSTLYIGEYAPALGFLLFTGRIQRATIATSLGGTPVVDFNPATYNAANSQTQWVSTSGETWTINTGTAATGYKGQLVTKTIIMGDGVDDQLAAATFSLNQPMSIYAVANRYSSTANIDYLFDLGQNRIVIFSNPTAAFSGGASLTYSPDVSLNRIGLFKFIVNSVNSIIGINNNTEQNMSAGSNNGNGLALLGSQPFQSANGNAILSSFIISNNANNLTQRTGMYDYIRSINNNAF
jgi:hypothetical protein